MGLRNVEQNYIGRIDGERGWKEDVKNMLLDTKKPKALEWRPRLNRRQAVEETTAQMIQAQDPSRQMQKDSESFMGRK